MAGMVDIDVAPGQAHAIKQVGNVKHQTFRRKRPPAPRDRKEKGKKDDGTKGGPGSEEQHSDSGNKSKKKKDSKVRGSLVDVVI